MKKIHFLSAFIILFTAFNFSSCSSEFEPVDPAIVIPDPTDPDPTDPTSPGVFKVDIDGVTYTALSTSVYITGGAIQIGAIRAAGDGFAFLLDGTATGTYPAIDNLLTYNVPGSEYGYWAYNPDDETENTGSLTITSIDAVNHKISGTFSFKGYWSDDLDTTPPAPKNFTNGVFTNLTYVTDSPTNDTFFAKVNGVDFNQNNLLAATIGSGADEFISIGVENAAGASMTVSVRSSVGTGTFPITTDTANDDAQIIYSPDGIEDGTAMSGQVIVTQKTATRIKGTFSGSVMVGTTPYQITAGSFDVEY